MGYMTFDPLINEDYDTLTDPQARMASVVAEIGRLCTMSLEEWASLRTKLRPILEHNFHRLMDQGRPYRIVADVGDRLAEIVSGG